MRPGGQPSAAVTAELAAVAAVAERSVPGNTIIILRGHRQSVQHSTHAAAKKRRRQKNSARKHLRPAFPKDGGRISWKPCGVDAVHFISGRPICADKTARNCGLVPVTKVSLRVRTRYPCSWAVDTDAGSHYGRTWADTTYSVHGRQKPSSVKMAHGRGCPK